MNYRLMKRWEEVEDNEVRYKEYFLEDAKFVVIGYGTAGRVAFSAVRTAREQVIPVGLLRPVTLSPFPQEQIEALTAQAEAILVTEMNAGQMLEDVLRVVKGRVPVEYYGRMGGMVPFPDEILAEINRLTSASLSTGSDPRRSWLERFSNVIDLTQGLI
jgi:2-oxoglutarate ferredoxin oxidoreductase subunit alpha